MQTVANDIGYVITCRIQNPDIPRAGRDWTGHDKASGAGPGRARRVKAERGGARRRRAVQRKAGRGGAGRVRAGRRLGSAVRARPLFLAADQLTDAFSLGFCKPFHTEHIQKFGRICVT